MGTFRNSTTQPGYLDLKGLAVYASCSVRWLRSRIADKSSPLPHYRIGGKVLVKVEEFDRWMASSRTRPQPNDIDQVVDDVIAKVASRKSA